MVATVAHCDLFLLPGGKHLEAKRAAFETGFAVEVFHPGPKLFLGGKKLS